MRLLRFVALGIIFSLVSTVCLAEDFPYRKEYPDVPVVELEDLKEGYDSGEFIIVDVRSGLEYDTIHPKKAIHIPMSDARFEEHMIQLAEKNPGKKIAVYCNGVTCLKSYNAARRSHEAGMFNVYCFDAGIPAWANAYPSETLLLGKQIENPQEQLIPKSDFKKQCLDYEVFKRRATEANAIVIDARDAIQRTEELPGLTDVKLIPLDKFIRNVVNRGVMKKKTLLIFDQVGKQVRWLMYHLENQGYADFHFLAGGATSVLKKQEYRKSSLKRKNLHQKDSVEDPAADVQESLAVQK